MMFTFGTDVGAGDAHLNAVLLHLHLVTGARSHAGAVVHHKVIWEQFIGNVKSSRLLFVTQEQKVAAEGSHHIKRAESDFQSDFASAMFYLFTWVFIHLFILSILYLNNY